MAVLLELSIFSIDGNVSKREEVTKVLKAWQKHGITAHLNAMGSVIEAQDMQEALQAIEIANACMDAKRYYAIAKFDCYPERKSMLEGRIERVLDRLK